ncbi:alpha/beta hydrolase [Sphingomonas sp.]|uniref:alpha/beta hydrolase n=1 Tax=Sphingomonas sp. TaxID=28214 RepID=UPI003D6CA696
MMRRSILGGAIALGLAATWSLAACASAGTPTTIDKKVIPLWPKGAPGSLPDMPAEVTELRASNPGTIMRNVTAPGLLVYPADPKIANGTAMIVAPGGGFHILSIENEGIAVAKWLNSLGVTVIVLKYRLIATGDDVQTALIGRLLNRSAMMRAVNPLQPLVTADGEQAVRYVRAHAKELKIKPNRVGLMGFSAGGAVSVWTTLANHADSRPDFLITIYPGLIAGHAAVPANAPPLFDLVADDDPIVRPEADELQQAWKAAGADTTYVTVPNGGHGFGMAKTGKASDVWPERLQQWLDAKGYLRK